MPNSPEDACTGIRRRGIRHRRLHRGAAATDARSDVLGHLRSDARPLRDRAPVILAPGQDSITLLPISPAGATIGVSYAYEMPHCGLGSPIDVDGSFWDGVGAPADPVMFDGAPGRFELVTRDAAAFTSSAGDVLRLIRHSGPKTFGLCF